MNFLPATILVLAISLVGWLYLRTWLDSRKFPSTSENTISKDQAGTPIAIDQLDAENSKEDSHGHTSWRADAIIALDGKMRLNWANRTAEQWFGFTLETNFREKLTGIIDQEDLVKYLDAGDYSTLLDCAAPGNRALTIRIRIVPYHQNQLLLQARDISQIKALELVRRDFVSNASHELRTPVSVLYGYLEMMKLDQSSGISDEWKPAVDQMYQQTERIKQIIEDMLLLSRLEESTTTQEHSFTAIDPLLESACKNAKVLSASSHHDISLKTFGNCLLLCNIEEIQSLITNLLSNAIRYTPDHGSIRSEWNVSENGGILTVSDTGIGIDEQDIPRVTERFYRSDPARSRESGGTGLGLAIVNHIVNRHEAVLTIKSKPGEGSRFSVQFPGHRIQVSKSQTDLMLN